LLGRLRQLTLLFVQGPKKHRCLALLCSSHSGNICSDFACCYPLPAIKMICWMLMLKLFRGVSFGFCKRSKWPWRLICLHCTFVLNFLIIDWYVNITFVATD
jgi:hypothetical protein